jgi:hypothetical protein
VSISRVSDLAFSACSIAGGHGRIATWCTIDYVSRGGTGVVASSSSLAIHDSIVSGGDGGDGGYYTAEGGNALNVYAGTAQAPGDALVFTSRSSLRGGSGGGNSECVIGCPSDGGDAFYLNTAVGWILDSIVAGGAEGALGARMCPADPGQQYPADDPLTIEAASLGLSIPSIAREGQFVTATFIGPPGARVFVNDQTTTTFEASLSWRGVLLSPFDTSGPPAREIKWGVIPASGVLTRTYAVPTLPAGEEAHTRYLQAYRVGPDGRITLGSFRTLTVLDSAF